MGRAPQLKNFDLPTDHLPRLGGKLILGPEFKERPDTTRLKLKRLVPEMSEALGLKTFSLVARRGFGCYFPATWGRMGRCLGIESNRSSQKTVPRD